MSSMRMPISINPSPSPSPSSSIHRPPLPTHITSTLTQLNSPPFPFPFSNPLKNKTKRKRGAQKRKPTLKLMKASKISTNSPQTPHHDKPFDSPTNTINTTTNLLYEPTSVLDPHLTSSPAAAGGPGLAHFHPSSLPPPSDDWDPLSFFLSPDTTEAAADSVTFDPFDLTDLDLPADTLPPIFERTHLDLLLKAAGAVESNDVTTAHVILSRLNSQIHLGCGSSPLQRAAFHFKDALLSLRPIQNPPTPFPAVSPLEIVNRITAHKTFSDLSPVPQFTSFTANQTILESLLDSSCNAQSLHIIDFDIGLGGQWSSFAQEIAARSKSLRSPPPHIRITAVVPDETAETVLAAENLRDFARAIGVHLTVSFVHVGNLGTLALGRVRVAAGEAVGVVLTPTIFRLVGGAPESLAALLRFVRQVSPRVVVFVDTECFGNSASFRRSFAGGLEYYSSVFESVDAAAAAVMAGGRGEVEAAVRRVEEKVMRPRIFGAVEGWAPREGGWREMLQANGMAPAGFSEFTESQAEWLLRRAPVEGFHVAGRDGCLVLSWRGRELATTSAWRC